MALQKFGPFELERRLGVGGMAETFVAVKRGPGGFEQKVCVKRILPALETDAEFVRLFLEEARLAAQLRHANVVQVVDFGEQHGQHYMALELVEGCDLRALLRGLAMKGEKITSGVLVFVATELAQALDFAHSRPAPIVHRDVSPSNVLLSHAGEVKLSDFGIARAMKGNEYTSTAQVKGKVPYMAPEYALSGRVDPRVDLFALGIVLYESLAGRRPYDGATELDTLKRSESGEHVPLGEICPTVPKAFVDAIERLIAPKADARFATANDFLDALVDVSAPPTARRILAELVRRIAPGQPAEPTASMTPELSVPGPAVDPVAPGPPVDPVAPGPPVDPVALTVAAIETPRGTVVQGARAHAVPSPPAPPLGGPADPTRTRAAAAGEVARAETALLHGVSSPTSAAGTPDALTAPLPATQEVSTFDPPAQPTTPAPAARSSRAPLVLGASGLALLGLIALGGWAWLGGPRAGTTPPPHPHPVTTPETHVVAPPRAPPTPHVAPPATPPGVPPVAAPVGALAPVAPLGAPATTATSDAGGAALDVRPAHLSISAYPFASVAIDGQRRGRSPVEADVPAGHHTITLTNGSIVRQRQVDLVPGQRRPLTVSME